MFETEIWNEHLVFETDPSLFSPNFADRGTLAMLNTVQLKQNDKVLDLGCGYGLVGIAAARVIGEKRVLMVDNNPKAVALSLYNAGLNHVSGLTIVCGDGVAVFGDTDFSLILSNPPYHTDFSVAKSFIEQGFRHLKTGGKMVLVVKRLDWYKNKMSSVFGGVKVLEADGYFILTSEKRSEVMIRVKQKQTTAKHEKKMLLSGTKKKKTF